jgi:hypothetical protein
MTDEIKADGTDESRIVPLDNPEYQKAVKAGDIETFEDNVTVSKEKYPSAPEGSVFEASVTLQKTKSLAGALATTGGREEVVWQLFDQAVNAARKMPVRAKLVYSLEGPDRAIRQAAKRLLKSPDYASFTEDELFNTLKALKDKAA